MPNMVAITTLSFIIFSLAVSLSSAVDTSLRSRDLTTCGSLKRCVLVNIQTRGETRLDGSDSFTLDSANSMGYSIRCDVNSDVGRLSNIKFTFDGKSSTESASPYYMLGDKASGATINPVPYLSTCGSKSIAIRGSLNDKVCFEKSFSIDVKNPAGASCDPGSPIAPVSPPVPPPVPAPVPVPSSGSCFFKVTGYTLIDSTRDIDWMPLGDYMVNDLPELLNIRVNILACRPSFVQSVLIDFDGTIRCENFAPYSVFGDISESDLANDRADYNGKRINVGRHVVKATPYTSDKCTGTAGKTHTLEFTVTEDSDDY